MNIKIIQHNISKELQQELDVYEAEDFHRKLELDAVHNFDDLNALLTQTKHFREIKAVFDNEAAATQGQSLKVLDVGVGVGLSSLLIATKGFSVTAIEPSLTCCKILLRAVEELKLPINIINSTAEELNQVDEKFDIGVFHASLHHCDDPIHALQIVRSRLKENGKLFLIEEPILRCYRTKKWFYRMLEEQPELMGHYGGNEHIYRIQEYIKFLRKAGFKKIKLIPSVIYADTPEKWLGDNKLRYFIKQRYYKFMHRILNHKHILMRGIANILIQLSLVYVTFEAEG